MSQKPIHTIRVGGVKASIWANDRGDGRILHTTSIVRSYLAEGGEWKETNTFLPTQLPELALATNEAFKFIHLQTRDPRKENGTGEQKDEADQRTDSHEQGEFASAADPSGNGSFSEKVEQSRGGRRGGRQ